MHFFTRQIIVLEAVCCMYSLPATPHVARHTNNFSGLFFTKVELPIKRNLPLPIINCSAYLSGSATRHLYASADLL